MTGVPHLDALADAIANVLQSGTDRDAFPHVYVASSRPITRLGFALEPNFDVAAWIASENLDAFFLHRPWRLNRDALPEGVGVVAFHQPFDATFTIGYNSRLADSLGMQKVTAFGEKDGTAIGMIGEMALQCWEPFTQLLRNEFGGLERVTTPIHSEIRVVAVVGAMTDALIRAAYHTGADAYVTGQMRVPARDAVQETGIGIVAVGHTRGEQWGLRTLAFLLRQRFPGLHTVVH